MSVSIGIWIIMRKVLNAQNLNLVRKWLDSSIILIELLKAQGGKDQTSIYTKQFSIENNLSRIGEWYAHTNANIGDRVRVEWLSETDILITLIRQQ